jgi:hypothetical protein
MSESKTKDSDVGEDDGMTAKQLASLYKTSEGVVWQEARNNDGVYMGMRYDPGTKRFYRD